MAIIGVELGRDAPLARPNLGPTGERVAQRLHLAARVSQIARRVELRDIATANDGESDIVHSVL